MKLTLWEHSTCNYVLLKWVWRFISSDGSLWSSIIRAIHGSRLESHSRKCVSPWGSILREVHVLETKGFDFLSHCKVRIGDGLSTSFWFDTWVEDLPLYARFPRVYALENDPNVCVGSKLNSPSLDYSFRRPARDGVERIQWEQLLALVENVSTTLNSDRWFCDLNGDGMFSVKDIRVHLDDLLLPSSAVATRWVRLVPIKVNILAWRARLDRLPTRGNLISRGIVVDTTVCPICDPMLEDSHHLFLSCDLAKCISRKLCRWWSIEWSDVSNFEDWHSWFANIRLSAKLKLMLEGVFYTAWWHIWWFRNRLLFDSSPPRRSVLFDDIVSSSFNWCVNRCNISFSWESWLKNPNMISL